MPEGVDVHRIQDAPERASAMPVIVNQPIPVEASQQRLELAVTIVDRTVLSRAGEKFGLLAPSPEC